MNEVAAASRPAIEFRGIRKAFGNVVANRDISFAVEAGTVHGIVGENGAGKTTLMSILFGLYRADAGEILVDGAPTAIRKPSDAISHGIGMVHQHFMLVGKMTALQNVILGAESGAWLAGGVGNGRREVGDIQKRYGLAFPLDELARNLSVGVQQRIEIVKALFRRASILILDEPTGVLTPQEVTLLFEVMRELKAAGKTIILITHKLNEIVEITDNVTVIRRGACVCTVPTAQVSRADLAEMMVGRKVGEVAVAHRPSTGKMALEVSGLTVKGRSGESGIDDLSFALREGEILGIAGVAGNGQSELLAALAGLRPVDGGAFSLHDHVVTQQAPATSRAIRRMGVAHVPEDRSHVGLIGAWDALENAIFGNHWCDRLPGVGRTFDWKAISRWCRELMVRRDVRPPDPHRRMSDFSGGNQQKLLIAREMALDPTILLIGQPTRGVDIGAIEAIHRDLLAERERGKAIVLVSVELDEIIALSDRVLVMFEGRSMGELSSGEISENLIGLMMAGIHKTSALGARREEGAPGGP